MKFLIDGVVTLVQRLPYEEGGHILQLRIDYTNPDRDGRALFESVLAILDRGEGGIMNERKVDADGFGEIRILSGLELPTILTLMGGRLAVTQTY